MQFFQQMTDDLRSDILEDNKVDETEAKQLAILDQNNKLTKALIAEVAKQTNVTVEEMQKQLAEAKKGATTGTD